MTIPRIVIVGGGVFGWFTALYFEKAFYKQGKQAEIIVIESSIIPELEWDQATSHLFMSELFDVGIDEFEFLREAKATFRYGIRHKNWKTKGIYFDGPIDPAHDQPEFKKLNKNQFWFYLECLAAKQPVSSIHQYTSLMDYNRSPYLKNGNTYNLLSPSTYSYHYDTAKFGAYLRAKRKSEHTIVLDGIVSGAELKGDSGLIDHLILEDGTRIQGDLFVDCSGVQRILISKALGSKWNDQTDYLPVNRAMTFWQDFDENEEIMTYTMSEAMDCGWMWTMPTFERKACGYVYSDRFINPDDAQLEVEEYLGKPIEPRNDIKFSSGFQEHALFGNCLSLGHSQCFFEPLESAAMHLFILQLKMFTKFDLHKILKGDYSDDQYNKDVRAHCLEMVDFINLHYTGGRKDTPFWEYITRLHRTEYVDDLLAKSSRRVPTPYDFGNPLSPIECLDGINYIPILDGLGKLNPSHARKELSLRPKQRKFTRNMFRYHIDYYKAISELGSSHRYFLEELNQGS